MYFGGWSCCKFGVCVYNFNKVFCLVEEDDFYVGLDCVRRVLFILFFVLLFVICKFKESKKCLDILLCLVMIEFLRILEIVEV